MGALKPTRIDLAEGSVRKPSNTLLSKVYKEEWACWCKWLNITSNMLIFPRGSISPNQISDILFFCERGMPHLNLQAQLPLWPPLTWRNSLYCPLFFPFRLHAAVFRRCTGTRTQGLCCCQGRGRQEEAARGADWGRNMGKGREFLVPSQVCMRVWIWKEEDPNLVW